MARPPHDAHFYRVSGPIFFNFRWFQSHFRSFQPARTTQYTHWRACGAKKKTPRFFFEGFWFFYLAEIYKCSRFRFQQIFQISKGQQHISSNQLIWCCVQQFGRKHFPHISQKISGRLRRPGTFTTGVWSKLKWSKVTWSKRKRAAGENFAIWSTNISIFSWFQSYFRSFEPALGSKRTGAPAAR